MFATRDADGIIPLVTDDYEAVHHPTGLTYDRRGALANWRAGLRGKDLTFAYEPLATLGDALALCRSSWSASGASGGKFDVGPYEHETIVLIEVDTQGRRRWAEHFAGDHLGDAVARLYERYAELLPDGPTRTRAAATARSIAPLTATVDLDRLAAAFAPAIEVVDHRSVGYGSLRGAEALLQAIRALLELTEGFSWRLDDVLGSHAGAFLTRQTSFGIERTGGGTFERTFWELWVFGADGLVTRWERFDLERDAEALARFDELVGSDVEGLTASPPATVSPRGVERRVRRVRSNAATACLVRIDAAVGAHDYDAVTALAAEGIEVVHHALGATFDRKEVLNLIRLLFQADSLALSHEALAVLGDALVLFRGSASFASLIENDLTFGASRSSHIHVCEVDDRGLLVWGEVFSDTRLGEPVARLYERCAERLPDGPARTHAAATAHSVAAMVAPPDLDRYAAALAPDVEFIDHRTVGFPSGRGANTLLRGFRSLFELADDLTTRIDDVLRLESGALLARWAISGIDRASGGAFESEFLLLWLFGPDGRVVHDETFDANRETEALARFDALVGSADTEAPAEPRATRFANAATRAWDRLLACWRARDWQRIARLLPVGFRYDDRRRMAQLELDWNQYLEFIRQIGEMGSTRVEQEVLATREDRLALTRLRLEVAGGDVGPSELEFLNLIETDERGDAVALVRFDPEDVDAAYAELDARYDAGEAAAHPHASAAMRAFPLALASRDWDALAALCAPASW
ncbi:MAG: nuclear transport factor 2 family protein [Deltaproteobacteria bacterium]|nr:nuclear transport factor 2 family protein [Deltaproteobacteria bacterium]